MEAVVEQFREFLRRRSLRVTETRDVITRLILSQKGHYDAEELVARLAAQGVQASRATVYRTLLREAGIIQSTVHSDEKQRYETAAGTTHHDHLVCTSCGRVVEFQFEAFEILQREVAARHGFRLTGHAHELFGICGECQASAGQGDQSRREGLARGAGC